LKKSELKTMAVWFLLMAVFISQLLLYTWCRVQCVRVGYEISREADNYRKLIALQNNLKLEIARLKSPDRIERIAKDQLGLVTPAPEQMIIIP
jgi:cell division protein FtsL